MQDALWSSERLQYSTLVLRLPGDHMTKIHRNPKGLKGNAGSRIELINHGQNKGISFKRNGPNRCPRKTIQNPRG
jgi:hypothetical protein